MSVEGQQVDAGGESGPGLSEIALERLPGGLARGHDARPAALAVHSHLLRVRVDGFHVQIHELLCP